MGQTNYMSLSKAESFLWLGVEVREVWSMRSTQPTIADLKMEGPYRKDKKEMNSINNQWTEEDLKNRIKTAAG